MNSDENLVYMSSRDMTSMKEKTRARYPDVDRRTFTPQLCSWMGIEIWNY